MAAVNPPAPALLLKARHPGARPAAASCRQATASQGRGAGQRTGAWRAGVHCRAPGDRHLDIETSQRGRSLVNLDNGPAARMDAGCASIAAAPPEPLVESLGPAPILLLVTCRPEYQHGWGSKTSYSQVRLEALADESEAKLLDALLGEDLALAPLKRLLVKGGNPFFFLEETVRTLVETKVLEGSPSHYRLSRSIETVEVTATVQGWRLVSTGFPRRTSVSCR